MDAIQEALKRFFPMGAKNAGLISPVGRPKQQEAYPGEEHFVRDMVAQHGDPFKDPSELTSDEWRQQYRQAVESPKFSGNYYEGATPTPTPQENPFQKAIASLRTVMGAHTSSAEDMPIPTPTDAPDRPIPSGTDMAMNYIKSKTNGQDPNSYYKALQDPQFMEKIKSADAIRPGLSNMLLMQAFNESTLGNANNGNNVFGALPGGETSGNHAAFPSDAAAVDYQLGPNVLGGGGNPNMNITHDQSPLTLKRVQQLYKSYNPQGQYIDSMLKALDSSRAASQ